MNAVHLCCGAGGITLGFERAGIRTVYAFDIQPVMVETHKANFPARLCEIRDIREMHGGDLPIAEVWTCGIPCEPFSRAGRKLGSADARDISLDVARLISEARDAGQPPHYVFLENVPEFASSPGAMAIWESLAGYVVFEAVMLHANYGVPQMRHRWHVVASLSAPKVIPEPTHCENGPDFFGLKRWVRFGDICDGRGVKPISARALRGIFRRLISNAVKYHNAYAPVIVEESTLLPTILSSEYKGAGRSQSVMIYDDGRLRPISFVEARRGQGFPDDYVFLGTVAERWIEVGQAVGPPVAEAVARAILNAEGDND